MDKLEYARHNGTGERGRAFWEPSDELVEEFFGGNLKVEWISAHLDEGIEQTDGENGDMWIAVVHCLNDEHRSFSWTVGFLFIDVLCDLDMKGVVIVWLGRRGNSGDEKLEL